jgi:hypothetical protein
VWPEFLPRGSAQHDGRNFEEALVIFIFGRLEAGIFEGLAEIMKFREVHMQVVEDVPYWRENAGIAKLLAVRRNSVSSKRPKTNIGPGECIELPPSHESETGEVVGL